MQPLVTVTSGLLPPVLGWQLPGWSGPICRSQAKQFDVARHSLPPCWELTFAVFMLILVNTAPKRRRAAYLHLVQTLGCQRNALRVASAAETRSGQELNQQR